MKINIINDFILVRPESTIKAIRSDNVGQGEVFESAVPDIEKGSYVVYEKKDLIIRFQDIEYMVLRKENIICIIG